MKNWLKGLLAPIIVAALVAGGANAAVWQWSKTADTNATADPTINWSEGMSPSSVNDSARAMMARIAGWRDDFSGLLATGGTSSAYTVTTNQGLSTTPSDGQLLAVTPHATNAASATLAADAGTAFPIQTAPGTAVGAGVLVSGTPYTVKFSTSASAWILRDYYGQPYSIPLGGVLDITGDSAPNSNFVLAFGQCISRTTYSAYFALVGTRFSACDGTTTFGVPDLRSRVVLGLDCMGGPCSGRTTNAPTGAGFDTSTAGQAGGAQSYALSVAQLPVHTPSGSVTVTAAGTISQITPAGSITNTTISVSDTRTWGTVGNTVTNPGSGGVWVTPSAGSQMTFGGQTVSVTGGAISASQSPAFSGSPVTPTFTGSPVSGTFTGNSIGSGTSYSSVQPSMALNKIVRIF